MAKKVFEITSDAKLLSRQIKSFETSNKSARERLSKMCVSCVLVAVKDGNCTPCRNLVNAAKGWRQNDMRAWFLANAPVVWGDVEREVEDKDGNLKTKKTKAFKMNTDKTVRKEFADRVKKDEGKFIKELMDKPFDASKQSDSAFKPFNLEAQLISLCARAKRVKDGDNGNDKRNNFNGYDKLVAFVNQEVKGLSDNNDNDNDTSITQVA